jgi:hypothetical protein
MHALGRLPVLYQMLDLATFEGTQTISDRDQEAPNPPDVGIELAHSGFLGMTAPSVSFG